MSVSSASTSTTSAQPPQQDESIGGLTRAYLSRIRGGDVGALPAVLGLVVLVVVFTILRPETFTNPFNFSNLINQSASVMVIAMGLVFVLLLGEIDLSAGFTAGTSACVMGIALTRNDFPWYVSVLICIATGAFIGTCIGLLVSRLGIPSFVVTLAAFLGLQGLMLVLIGEGGTIAFRNSTIVAIMNKNLPLWLGWTMCLGGLAIYGFVTLRNATSRRAAGLQGDPLVLWAFKTGLLSAVLIAATAYLSQERSRNPAITSLKGVPIVVAVLVFLLVVLTFALSRTAWGRHVYAVGGNAEAARRAGINVDNIKIACFAICSMMAALGGIVLASRLRSVDTGAGGGSILLYSIAAAVIGGTSLFGGRGHIKSAVLGALVIASIDNGLGLLGLSAGTKFVITAGVLLLAVTVDSVARKGRESSGRA
jgi:D-xylose transport system permease protein